MEGADTRQQGLISRWEGGNEVLLMTCPTLRDILLSKRDALVSFGCRANQTNGSQISDLELTKRLRISMRTNSAKRASRCSSVVKTEFRSQRSCRGT
jgi:hypothetical protein